MPAGRTFIPILTIVCLALAAFSHLARASAHRVLVVMSYERQNPWEQEIRQGLEAILRDHCELRFFYMDTKRHLAQGPAMAKEALALYHRFSPQGVIAADDNAQSLFVVPYLRNREETAVIFCGVNSEPEAYGYPAANVTGVLERPHFREAIAFAQMLQPEIRTVGFLMRDTPTTRAIKANIELEWNTYPAETLPITTINTFAEAKRAVARFRKSCDALVLTNLNALLDEAGAPLTEAAVIDPLVQDFGKATLGTSPYHVQFGTLLTVANSGVEQGTLAGGMMLQYLRGTPVSKLPITRNRRGQRMINLKTMRALGITPIPAALVGVAYYGEE
ncbi:MAG: ABC transporter substrate binding protein [Desulfosarcinaceae bacterium]|nr:ABC transporter substrate binding protein [Desulfosarcinaceae bacterium]